MRGRKRGEGHGAVTGRWTGAKAKSRRIQEEHDKVEGVIGWLTLRLSTLPDALSIKLG